MISIFYFNNGINVLSWGLWGKDKDQWIKKYHATYVYMIKLNNNMLNNNV